MDLGCNDKSFLLKITLLVAPSVTITVHAAVVLHIVAPFSFGG